MIAKRIYFLFLSTVILLFTASISTAEEDLPRNVKKNDYYIGLGGSYAFEDFDGVDFKSKGGGNLQFGYFFTNVVSLGVDFDYFQFELDESSTFLTDLTVKPKADLDIVTVLVTMKVSYDQGVVRPFFFYGLGAMYANIDGNVPVSQIELTTTDDDEVAPAGQIGAGIDFVPIEEISIGLRGSAVMGTRDLLEIRYIPFTLGVAYRF